MLSRAPFIGALSTYILVALILSSSNFQVSSGSRRFLTGLIIGTLLGKYHDAPPMQARLETNHRSIPPFPPARNGMPAYPAPASQSHYSAGHQHQQQPLFIIIPSASGKSYKPQVVAPYANMYSPPPLDYHGHSNRRSIFRGTGPKSTARSIRVASSSLNRHQAFPLVDTARNTTPVSIHATDAEEVRL